MAELVEEVAPGVFRGRGTQVNWYLLRVADGVTLIDGGYPGDADRLEASVRALGRRPEDVRAVLLTHAHVDHLGGVSRFAARHGTPVHTGAVEVRHAHREFLEQAGPKDVVANLWRPGVLPWTARIVRAGALAHVAVPTATAFPADGPLDLPGAPVPVATPGHTSGHTCYHLPAVGAVVTGDALVTGHALLRASGPQLLPAMFHHGDPVAGLAPLANLDADLVLPGHGEPWHGALAAAVARAAGSARP